MDGIDALALIAHEEENTITIQRAEKNGDIGLMGMLTLATAIENVYKNHMPIIELREKLSADGAIEVRDKNPENHVPLEATEGKVILISEETKE